MAVFRTLTLLLGALAVLTLGALAAPGQAEAMPPCHEAAHGQETPAGAPSPDKSMKPMGCCVACVATVAPEPPLRSAVVLPSPARKASTMVMPLGETLTPEPHPPRLINA